MAFDAAAPFTASQFSDFAAMLCRRVAKSNGQKRWIARRELAGFESGNVYKALAAFELETL